MLKPGDKAPDFKLKTDTGQTFQLSKQKGHAVVVYFYPKDDTSGCTAEARDFSLAHNEFSANDITVIGISPDSVESHQKFKEKHGFSVLLGADEDKSVIEKYGVWVEKKMYGRTHFGIEFDSRRYGSTPRR